MLAETTEESLTDILSRYEAKGYKTQFASWPDGMVHCYACGDDTPSDQVPVAALHRLEGTSDPGEEMVVAALECPSCGALGTLALSYGPGSSAEDAGVLASLLDDREHSGIEPGT